MVNNQNKPLQALIIGCGNIAGGFDRLDPPPALPCTHAGAYQKNPKFNIIACVEPNQETRNQFKAYWDIEYAYSTIEQVINEPLEIDVISICSPSQYHKDNILQAVKLAPKVIFCEKPIANTLTESEEIIRCCKEANILLAINYTRRWDPNIIQLKEHIRNEYYGKLRSIAGFYNKGILNNGSHLLDILNFLLGKLDLVSSLPGTADYFSHDLTIPSLLVSESNIPIHLITAHANDYSLVELEFIFENAILKMEQGGLTWSIRQKIPSARFPAYSVLGDPSYYPGRYEEAMTDAIENIYQSITKNTPLNSNDTNAMETQLLVEKIKQTATTSRQ